MLLKRNGFEIEIHNYGRGQWTYDVISKDGDPVHEVNMIEFAPKAYAIKQAKQFADRAVWVRGLGYCVA